MTGEAGTAGGLGAATLGGEAGAPGGFGTVRAGGAGEPGAGNC